MLIFEPGHNEIIWYAMNTDGSLAQGSLSGGGELTSCLRQMPEFQAAETLIYLWPHGGADFTAPVYALDAELTEKLENCLALDREGNSLALRTIRAAQALRPSARHYLLVDTAYFAALPEVANAYPLPSGLRGRDVRRWGGDGLCHQWAAEHARLKLGGPHRLVSLHLSDTPNVAAILDGCAVDTSLGFRQSESIPGLENVGDLDPSIVLDLGAAGWLPEASQHLLLRQSGFKALAGADVRMPDLLESQAPELSLAKEALWRTTLKTLGAAMAALGGVDALAITCDDLDAAKDWTRALVGDLAFAGFQLRPEWSIYDGAVWLTGPDSPAQAVAWAYPRGAALAGWLRDYFTESGLEN
jgi:acetate kinase